jgi:hypothetical protein
MGTNCRRCLRRRGRLHQAPQSLATGTGTGRFTGRRSRLSVIRDCFFGGISRRLRCRQPVRIAGHKSPERFAGGRGRCGNRRQGRRRVSDRRQNGSVVCDCEQRVAVGATGLSAGRWLDEPQHLATRTDQFHRHSQPLSRVVRPRATSNSLTAGISMATIVNP